MMREKGWGMRNIMAAAERRRESTIRPGERAKCARRGWSSLPGRPLLEIPWENRKETVMRTKFSDRGKEKTVWIGAPLHSKKAASKKREAAVRSTTPVTHHRMVSTRAARMTDCCRVKPRGRSRRIRAGSTSVSTKRRARRRFAASGALTRVSINVPLTVSAPWGPPERCGGPSHAAPGKSGA